MQRTQVRQGGPHTDAVVWPPGGHTVQTWAKHSHFPISLKECEKLPEGALVSGVPWPWGQSVCVSPCCLHPCLPLSRVFHVNNLLHTTPSPVATMPSHLSDENTEAWPGDGHSHTRYCRVLEKGHGVFEEVSRRRRGLIQVTPGCFSDSKAGNNPTGIRRTPDLCGPTV